MKMPRIPHEVMAMLTPALGRVVERSARGGTLMMWGLRPHAADPGTPMDLDEADGYDEKIPEGIARTVAFPIMNATDALSTTNLLISNAARSTPMNHHTPAFLALCRTAIECSSQAIWAMCPEDRADRRARAAGLAKTGLEHARDYHADAISAHDSGLLKIPDRTYKQSQHRREFHQGELDELAKLSPQNARKYTELVRKAANWIEDHPPAHTNDTKGVHFPTIAQSQYRQCSSFTHGHSWPIDLIQGPTAMFKMMADSINTALITTEVAVCLFEAQSTDPNGSRENFYPARLQPTIDAWRERYSATTEDSPPPVPAEDSTPTQTPEA
ncbi:hypothetical protein P0W64_09315 [Tsukamurella sp. 8F]|uniref:hypothetical protein n=1 Tax=unclassified Tsukamurella TaxID=2633480 RepID=UPI0023B9E305|nr:MULTISPECIES: hypothetical protein [unclassified Tsukamurella]MDF0529778.1 hypothetical protein [Tsukamurella sp. 8J]MDF0586970.1 hypothetical protein [Tsukamurella sp. 8F]